MLAGVELFVFEAVLSEVEPFLWKHLKANCLHEVNVGNLAILVLVELAQEPIKLVRRQTP